MKKLTGFILLLIYSSINFAQPVSRSSAEIMLSLQKLNTVGSVLYIAAHPDDENTRLLSYLSKEAKVRTGYLSLTRGDGGQNLIGKEQGEMLGLIRTQELLAARRVDGAEQYFSRAYDFGYSKTPEETFSFWNHDSILSDVVWVIRNFKPDIIVCRFPTTGEGGHGHHTASAILALEAFSAAANPMMFSWQTKYVPAWQAKSIFWNTFNFGTTNTTAESQLHFDVGVYNNLLGKSYGELAAESRSMHKSQGFGSAKQRGEIMEYFKRIQGDSCKQHLLENINVSWHRVKGGSEIYTLINQCINSFNLEKPYESLPALLNIRNKINDLPFDDDMAVHWKKIKIKEIESIIIDCSGLWIENTANDYMAVPGGDIIIKTEAVSRSPVNIQVNKISYTNSVDTIVVKRLDWNKSFSLTHKLSLDSGCLYSNPYWLDREHGNGRFEVTDKLMIGQAENNPAINVVYYIQIGNEELEVTRPLVYKYTDPVKGEIYRPFEILPPVTINFTEKVYVYPNKQSGFIDVVVKANKQNFKGELILDAPGFDLKYDKQIKIEKKGDEQVVKIKVTPQSTESSTMLKALIKADDRTFDKSINRVDYDHIPAQFVLSNAEVKLIGLNINIKGNNIGYINGAGDEVSACLRQVGYKVTELSDNMIEHDDLSQYNAILTGIRAYNINERLQVYHPKLMEYIKQGGNLVVQYNTNNRIGPVKAVIGPYPFTISRDRVTDENAVVNILQPNHPVFNTPNKISNKDFDDWIQERGIYFATEMDSHYQPLLSLADTNESPHQGSLIVSPYGKGNFVYTGLVFFRELPAGIPGAYRLFSNLLNIPKNK